MATKVYKEGGFIVIDQDKFTQVMRVPVGDFDSSQIGDTDSIEMYEKNLPATHRRVELFSDIQDEAENPIGATIEEVLSYLSDLATSTPSGGGNVTVTGDTVFQTKENHTPTIVNGSGAATIPAGYYSVLIVRRSGNVDLSTGSGDTFRLNNAYRSINLTGQQTRQTNVGTPQIEILGGNWQYFAIDRKN